MFSIHTSAPSNTVTITFDNEATISELVEALNKVKENFSQIKFHLELVFNSLNNISLKNLNNLNEVECDNIQSVAIRFYSNSTNVLKHFSLFFILKLIVFKCDVQIAKDAIKC